MKRVFIGAILMGVLGAGALAQTNDPNAPATKEDIARYFEAVHSRQMLDQMADAMSKSTHQMVHDMYLKDKDKLPPDFEEQASKHVDEMFKNMPWDEMMQAMMPVYQKHFTKGDIDAVVAFYNSPTGQKMVRQLPAILSESMQAMMPIMEKYMDAMRQRLNDEFAQALKQSEKKSN
jgi:hypothetical protein